MKKFGYSAAVLAVSACALFAMPPQAHADANSDAEIAALKTQLKDMAEQQKKAAAVIEKLAAQVDNLQKQTTVQASKVSAIEDKQQVAHITQLAQPSALAMVEPAAGNSASTSTSAGNSDYSARGSYDSDSHGGAYLGVFGGGGVRGDTTARQLGTAYFVEAAGGPQSINAKGKLKNGGTGIVGAQAGYEWAGGAHVRPAVEVEALYLPRTDQHGTLDNSDPRLTEQLFDDTLPTSTSVVLANAVLGFKTPYQSITPYVGGGVGAAYLATSNANSAQLSPSEPGVNHFNSDTSSSVLTAAAQLKAGVRMALTKNTYLFGEYRYLYIGSHDQTFGSATDPAHVPTSPATVSYSGTSYNLGTVGLGVKF